MLTSVGINPNTLVFKGQGTYNTVYEGPHPKPAVNPGQVALRVASGPIGDIENEEQTATEMGKLIPKNWEQYRDKFSVFAKALCVPEVDVDPRYVKQAKYYRKYLNIPQIYAKFSEDNVRDILEKNIRMYKKRKEK